MNFFSDLKKAEFARKLFAAAGHDFEAIFAANDEKALATILDLAKSAAPAPAADAELLDTLQSAVDEAVAENATLETRLTALSAALETSGVKAENPEGLSAALEKRIATRARELLAATGGPVLSDSPTPSPAAPPAAAQPLFGLARVEAALRASRN